MRKFALVAGVENYRDEMISQVRYACADAKALAKVLGSRCGFERVQVLAAESGEDEPIVGNIVKALRDTASELRQDDLFLFFFAGHGIERDGHGYLLARDSSQAFPEIGNLSLDTLRKSFERLSAGKRILLLDACRNSPDAGRGDTANYMSDAISRDIVAAARSQRQAGTTTALLCACRSGQRAYEWPQKKHGVFTQYLIEGLEGAAWENGELDFKQLANYAARQVREWAASMPGLPTPQTPWYQEFGDPESIVLASDDVASAHRQSMEAFPSEPRHGRIQVLEESFLHIESVPTGADLDVDGRFAGRTPLKLSLKAGEHYIVAKKESYEPWERKIRYDAAGDARLKVELRKCSRTSETSSPPLRASKGGVEDVTEKEWEQEVLESAIPVIVDFWAPWCGPCKFLGPVFEELAGDYVGKVKFVKLNTDESQNVAIKYGIMGIPTLKVFKGGAEVDTMSGAAPREYVKDFLDKALTK